MNKQDNFKEIENPQVDIILPNYNKGTFLRECLNSVFSQTYKNWNLYIIDDNSKDDSKKIIESFKNRSDNINVIYLKKNKGVAFCRNLGIRSSFSKYISFIDSDDFWSKDKLERQIFFMEKFKHTFTYTNYTTFVVRNNNKIFKKKILVPNGFNYEKFIKDSSLPMSSMIIERSIVGTIKFQKVKICEDYLFKCAILKKNNKAVKFNENSMFYQISSNSLQSNKLRNFYWVWYINKNYNHMSLFQNLKSLFFIIISSVKRYGIK